MPNQSIAEFYAGKSLFITGATGFLGKVLIEKLLYSCPNINKIYILIREKKGETADERLKKIFNEPLFQRLKDQKPKNLEKLVPITGNIGSPDVGISKENKETLIEKVSIVIHAAATVKFDDPLKETWIMIIDGTRRILELARSMKRIEVFIYISTAYSNLDRQVIEDILYPAPANLEDVQQLLKQDITKEETIKIIGTRGNTYIFTKAIAENIVAENQVNIPIVIIRPSIVGASINEPVKGWLQNWYAATGLMIGTAKGLNRVIYGRGSNVLDIIPVDYVINLLIVAGAKNYRSKLNIYNICSSDSNPVNLDMILKTASNEAVKRKIHYMALPQWYIFTRCSWIVSIVTVLFQIIPAYLGDLFRLISGKSAIYRKLQTQLIRTRASQQLFTYNSWLIKADRARNLFSSLSLEDRQIFPFDPTTIEWSKYIKDYVEGVEKFLVRRDK